MPVTGPLQDPKTGRMLRFSTAKERNTPGHRSQEMEYLDEKFWVTVSPDVTPAQLAQTLDLVRDIAQDIHEYATHLKGIRGIGAVGKYSQLATSANKLKKQIQGGAVRGAVLGKLTDEQIMDLRTSFAKTLSLDLTKLNSAADYMERHGVMDKKAFEVAPWAAEGLAILLQATISVIREMVAFAMWEGRKQDRKSDMGEVIDGLIKRDSGYSADEEGVPALPGMEPVEDWVLPGDSLQEG